jgi:3-methyladenine DNA glycosylase AlkC
MPGKLRRRGAAGSGLSAEQFEQSSLPLIEAACAAAGVPRAFGLKQELIRAGYFNLGIVGQWSLAQERLAERVAESSDPLALLRRLAASAEPRMRFHVPGMMARFLANHPERVIEELRPLAADENKYVAEAVQAFGVRPQAAALGPEVLQLLHSWVTDPSPYVRRAAIEAVRPRGVWVKHLAWSVDAPALLLPLFEALRGDPEIYVANAVGNALNDISKKKPELVLEIASRWTTEGEAGPLQAHMVRKALRTMVKVGDPRALSLLGYGQLDVRLQAKLRNPQPVGPNSALVMEIEVQNDGPSGKANLVYEIETPGKHPQRPRRKRYQAGTVEIPGYCTSELRIRERIFDRKAAKLIDGACAVKLFLNGKQYAVLNFELKRP